MRRFRYMPAAEMAERYSRSHMTWGATAPSAYHSARDWTPA